MTKLKTLKDMPKLIERSFETFTEKEGVNPIRIKYISEEQLKQEAIKWAKHYGYHHEGDFCTFFNISEEDLA